MLTYLLIGLGGALGSMARASLGTAMSALTGPSFPWGTILINVIGSFVIGCFGTLTATDGRFAVPFDVRAFVMVGICGGFTTFSSFSLQTIELLHDGRSWQALGNIALSVALCLCSVAAGGAIALSVRTSSLAMVGDAAPGAFSSTLLALHRPEAVPGMLEIARQLMMREDGRILALAIDGPVLAALQPTEEVSTAARRVNEARRSDWVGGMRSTLDRWVAAERESGHSARWVEVRGDGALAVAEHGRNAHLLLLEQQPGDATAHARIHAALVRAGRPVLLVPSGHAGDFGRVVAVAWRDDRNTRAAVRTAYPLLSKAERVVVIEVGPQADVRNLPDLFDGLPVERLAASAGEENLGTQLLELTHQAGAGLLVMGSRGRGRIREALFDGVTESVIDRADLPVLMQHRDG